MKAADYIAELRTALGPRYSKALDDPPVVEAVNEGSIDITMLRSLSALARKETEYRDSIGKEDTNSSVLNELVFLVFAATLKYSPILEKTDAPTSYRFHAWDAEFETTIRFRSKALDNIFHSAFFRYEGKDGTPTKVRLKVIDNCRNLVYGGGFGSYRLGPGSLEESCRKAEALLRKTSEVRRYRNMSS